MSVDRINPNQFYTRKETAQLLNISERQVANLSQSGRLKRVKISGASVRHSGAQILQFIEAATEDAE